jgi:NAD(P)-dependent dehydrogenase (short-subunit alcohol dehydrogenase family)
VASYVAAKHAALGYLRALAADLAPTGVTVNGVLPGSTRTALLVRTAAA